MLLDRFASACRVSAAVILCAITPAAVMAAPPSYQLVGSFTSPGGSFDIGPDGRVYTLVGRTILRQDEPAASTFSAIAELPVGSVGSFGASFLRFNASGSRVAVGDGNFNAGAAVHLLDASSFPAAPTGPTAVTILSTFTTPNFDAAWDGDQLYITGARSSDFVPIVNRIDTTSAAAPQTVITGIGLASGGIAIRDGHLLTGSGFLPTGEIRRFDLAALSTSPPTSFSSGTLVGSFLSASPLDFDALGNLLVGGGDAFSGTSDTGYAAVVDPADPANFLRLSPAGTATTYSPIFNSLTGEVLVYDTATAIFHRYLVPSPAAGGLLILAAASQTRRRRR